MISSREKLFEWNMDTQTLAKDNILVETYDWKQTNKQTARKNDFQRHGNNNNNNK